MTYNLDNKAFVLLENSELGTVDQATIFNYKQNGNIVTADYHGGQIHHGKIVGKLESNKMTMLYHCLTKDGELKAGQALAKITKGSDNKLRLDLDWKWIGDHSGSGSSCYLEVN